MADPTLDKTPMGNTSVNRPESGTYGEGAALDQLHADLPPMADPGADELGPAPMPQPSPAVPGGAGGRPPDLPPGVPPGLLAGDAPPMEQPGGPGDLEQARIVLLQQLASSPEVSEATQEWAQMVLEMILGDA